MFLIAHIFFWRSSAEGVAWGTQSWISALIDTEDGTEGHGVGFSTGSIGAVQHGPSAVGPGVWGTEWFGPPNPYKLMLST